MLSQLEQFKLDVDHGLSAEQKSLSSKYFYDAVGDGLFQQIMHMPEYYLSNAELEIFRQQHAQISQELVQGQNKIEIIELGAGDGSKVIHLLQALWQKVDFDFIPIDISANALSLLKGNIQQAAPAFSVHHIQGEYFASLDRVAENPVPKVVLFLGSNLGNLDDTQARAFLQRLDRALRPQDKVLLGLDITKDPDTVINAYNDAQGITRQFNLNLLQRINRELGGNFELDCFDHAPIYVEETSTAESYLRSLKQQEVHIHSLNKTYQFHTNEMIHTEISRKYDQATLETLLQGTRFEISASFSDSEARFCDFILSIKQASD